MLGTGHVPSIMVSFQYGIIIIIITVEPRLSTLVRTRRHSPDNQGSG